MASPSAGYPDLVDRSPSSSPRLVERWEALDAGRQAAIAYPLLTLGLFIAHWAFPGLRDEPLLAFAYGLLWAIPATVAVVSATAFERRKRARARGHSSDAGGRDG